MNDKKHRLKKYLPLFLVFLVITGCQKSATPEKQLLQNLSTTVIVPAFENFSGSVIQLRQASNEFCANTDTNSYENARLQWKQAMTSWQQVRMFSFGPMSVDNQQWKIQFWPDKHNLVRKKLNELLTSDDDLNLQRIAKASVVTQGLSALEYLLFDETGGALKAYQNASNDKATRQCQLLTAISEHTESVAMSLSNEWSENYAAIFSQPSEKNPEYLTEQAAIATALDTILAALEFIKGDQLARPLGYRAKGDRARPYMSEAWRSRYSTQSIAAHLQSVQNMYLGNYSHITGYGFDDYLEYRDQQALHTKIDTLLNQLVDQAKRAPAMFEGVQVDEQRDQLKQIYTGLEQLIKLVKYDMPIALDVQLGFNANDGD